MDATQAKILVVDDEEKNVKLMEALLVPRGYTVSKAYDGEEALRRVAGEAPDLILLDVMMPVMNGFEVCRKLKDDADTRLIPIVIMTALDRPEDRVTGIEADADDFLTKPVNRDELLARIRTALRLKATVESKLARLRGAQQYLARFVPQSVARRLEEHPEAPVLEKTDQDLSAMFVDVTAYTRLSEELRQSADFMVEKYFSRFLDSVREHGGDVTETSGDGMMAIFAGHEANEHANNAVEAALEILGKASELNAQLEGIFEPLQVHIGINSGIALIGPTKYEGDSGARWTYTALGSVVNVAARIAGVAEPGTICVGPETARRLSSAFPTRLLGRKQLKNVSGAVTVYQVLSGTCE